MGAVYQHKLDPLTNQLVDMIRLVHDAMSHATAALIDADPPVADSVMATDRALHSLGHEIEDHASAILAARDQLLATDLPTVLACTHINADMECMGELARSMIDIARSPRSRPPIPPQPHAIVREMSQIGLDLATKAGDIVKSRRADHVAELHGGADQIRRLEQLYRQLLFGKTSTEVRTAIDVTLAGRLYARYAEHAVSVARHAELLVVDAPDT